MCVCKFSQILFQSIALYGEQLPHDNETFFYPIYSLVRNRNIRAYVIASWTARTMIRQRGIWRIPRRVFREHNPCHAYKNSLPDITRGLAHANTGADFHTSAEKNGDNALHRIPRWNALIDSNIREFAKLHTRYDDDINELSLQKKKRIRWKHCTFFIDFRYYKRHDDFISYVRFLSTIN